MKVVLRLDFCKLCADFEIRSQQVVCKICPKPAFAAKYVNVGYGPFASIDIKG